ncbi:MAG: cytochrome P450 [Gammaproteobacteria bacterium]
MEQFNPCITLLQRDPYPVYRQYRRNDPVHLGLPPLPEYPESWYLFRYDDIESVLKNRAFINERTKANYALPCSPALLEREPLWQILEKWILLSDPPAHTRIRSSVTGAFTKKSVQLLEPLIQRTANQLLDKVIARGEMDLVEDYAAPLPLAVISQLLGIHIEPPGQFRTWSKAVANALDTASGPDFYDRALQLMTDIVGQLKHDFRDKRRDNADDGLIADLLAAQSGADGLQDDELISLCTLLMFAGQETTIDAIGNCVLSLLQHPDQLGKLVADHALLPGAVEELLRYNSPLQMAVVRVAAEDTEVGGRLLRRGDNVTAVLGAANRDPEKFPDPDCLDITRIIGARNVIFGQGIHICLGAHLARLELQIALGSLLHRVKAMHLKSDQLQWRNNVSFRGLTTLPVTFEPS